MTLGEYLKKCRGERTLGQISEYSGIDKGYLSKIERNGRKPKPEMLLKLSEAYKTDYIELMTLCGYIAKTDDPTPPNKKALSEQPTIEESIANDTELSEESKQDLLKQLDMLKMRDNLKKYNKDGSSELQSKPN